MIAKKKIIINKVKYKVNRLTTNFPQTNNLKLMDWPSLSSDLAPIEHVGTPASYLPEGREGFASRMAAHTPERHQPIDSMRRVQGLESC